MSAPFNTTLEAILQSVSTVGLKEADLTSAFPAFGPPFPPSAGPTVSRINYNFLLRTSVAASPQLSKDWNNFAAHSWPVKQVATRPAKPPALNSRLTRWPKLATAPKRSPSQPACSWAESAALPSATSALVTREPRQGCLPFTQPRFASPSSDLAAAKKLVHSRRETLQPLGAPRYDLAPSAGTRPNTPTRGAQARCPPPSHRPTTRPNRRHDVS